MTDDDNRKQSKDQTANERATIVDTPDSDPRTDPGDDGSGNENGED